jgi:hypothetical protein
MSIPRDAGESSFSTIKYTPVKKNHLSPETIKRPYQVYHSKTKNWSPRDLHEHRLRLKPSLAEINRIEPSSRIQDAVEFGKSLILEVAEENTPENKRDMEVIFLLPYQYSEIIGSDSSGSMSPGVKPVFVEYEERFFDFITASVAFHELVHRWVDTQQFVFHSEVNADTDIKKISYELRRVGAQIQRLVRDMFTGEITSIGFLGEVINELGNFAWQNIFIHKLLTDPKLSKQFKDEIEFRNRKLEKVFGPSLKGANQFVVIIEGNKEYTVWLESKNMFWDKEGELLVEPSVFFMQLVYELHALIPEVEEKNFATMLIDIKLNPAKQNALRKAIDSKLGKGFYQKLRRLSYNVDSALSILEEIQPLTRQQESE